MNIKLEYIIFIIIVLYFSLKECINARKEIKESSSIIKKSISITDSKQNTINGIYNHQEKLFNNAVVYKHETNDFWIYKVIEHVNKEEINCYWILGNKDPLLLNNSRCPDENIIFHSISIVDIGDFYIYQYVDFGNSIISDDLVMFSKLDDKIMLKITINK